MVKKILAVVVTIMIAFTWFITLSHIGKLGPLKDYISLGLDISGGVYVVMEGQDLPTDPQERDKLMQQTQSVIDNRVNEMGLAETVVTVEGDSRIRVELPGAKDADEAIKAVGETAQLKFLLADGTEALTGADIADAGVQPDQQRGGYLVTLKFTADGAKKFLDATTKASAGDVLSENIMKGEDGEVAQTIDGDVVQASSIVIMLDDAIISAPTAKEPIDSRDAEITGDFTQKDAAKLSMWIRGGALPIELVEVESSSIGASIGMDALSNSIFAGTIGIILILLLMLGIYRLFGLAANLALMLYVPMLLWWLVLSGATLTLPGIAGIVLSIGMAVDANVIIIARIKEEVGHGKTIRVAARDGFRHALPSVLDSQITTIIAAVVLYLFGNGPVKGFAFTLASGIVIGLFTALIIAQIYVGVFAETKIFAKPGLLGVKEGEANQHTSLKKRFNFIENRKIFYIVTVVVLVIGIGTGLIRGFNSGIDFTGGTRLQIEVGTDISNEDLDKTLKANGVNDAEIVRYGEGATAGVNIKTTQAINNELHQQILNAFNKDLGIEKAQEVTFEQFGPSIGKMLTNNAIKSVLIAALCMLIYVAIRFKWRYGVAAVIAVFHDVLILIAFYGLFHVTINNPFIAAILTVVGYSINDTIVIFDRIRENTTLMHRTPFVEMIDTSINQTLVRSLMTSFSTVLAIVPLVIFGGDTIRQFTVPLMVGILAGAASSIFIASPIFFELSKIGGGGQRGKGRSKYLEQTAKSGKKNRASGSGLETDYDETAKEPAKPQNVNSKGKAKKSKAKRNSSKTGGAVV